MQVHRVGGTLSVVNQVPLEQYLYGVVPAEMPSSWHPEALKAQAIVARSYGIATRKPGGLYDAHADTRSQMYSGIEAEQATTNAAVDATAGAVALSGGSVIPAFFYSTSGGRTAAIEDVWASAPRPYLKSKPDPYEVSPYSNWSVVLTPGQLASKLGSAAKGTLRRVDVSLNASQRAKSVSVVGSGGTTSLSGTSFQYRLGLRSSYYRVEQLAIDSAKRRVPNGSRILLTGAAPKGGATYLVIKSGDTWVRATRLKPRAGGGWTKRVRVRSTTGGVTFGVQRSGQVGPTVLIRTTR
jgi:stage II sporulation protein D